MRRPSLLGRAAGAATLVAFASSCSLLAEPESCELGALSCDGRDIRVCVVDVNDVQSGLGSALRPSSTSKKGRWSTQRACEDDPLLGASTCGLVEGKPACVSKSDAGAAMMVTASLLSSDAPPSNWLRIDVTREAGTTNYTITGIEEVTLPSPPLTPAIGTIAAVGYAQDKVQDASLVAFTDSSVTSQSVWLRSDGLTRLALVGPGESAPVLFEVHRTSPAPAVSAPKSALLNVHAQALDQASIAGVRIVPVTTPDALVAVLEPIFGMVPPGPLTLVREVSLGVDLTSESFAATHSAADVRMMQAEAANTPSPPSPAAQLLPTGSRAVVVNNQLLLQMRSSDIEDYIQHPGAVALEITRALGAAYVRASVFATQAALLAPVLGDAPQRGDAFSSTITPQLQARVSPLLGKGEALTDAWAELHQSAVDLGMSQPYAIEAGALPNSDQDAVALGFASRQGAADPGSDLIEYLARVSVATEWAFGPCAAIRASVVDELDPKYVLALAKLAALRGLGLITGGQFKICTGDLSIGGEPGLVFHSSTGQSLPFTTEFQAVYQPFFGGQVHISWVSHRGYVSTSLDIGYRGTLVPAIRLGTQVGSDGQDIRKGDAAAAVLAILNATSYQTVKATGGMVAATQIVRDGNRDRHSDRLDGIAFFVTLSEPVWGSSVYPLVTAKATAPVWGDAP